MRFARYQRDDLYALPAPTADLVGELFGNAEANFFIRICRPFNISHGFVVLLATSRLCFSVVPVRAFLCGFAAGLRCLVGQLLNSAALFDCVGNLGFCNGPPVVNPSLALSDRRALASVRGRREAAT